MSSQASNQTSQYLIKLMTNGVLSTIQLCGFDLQANEKQHKIQFNLNLFSKPNLKAFEVIVHFLLCQLDPERAEKVFAQCWPVLMKEQQKDFRDAIFNWLVELTTKNTNNIKQLPQQQTQVSQLQQQYQSLLQFIRFPIVSKSLLLTPGNLKICELLFLYRNMFF